MEVCGCIILTSICIDERQIHVYICIRLIQKNYSHIFTKGRMVFESSILVWMTASCQFNVQLQIVFYFLSVWHNNHFPFLHSLLSNFPMNLGNCISSFFYYMFWEQYRKCCLQEWEVLLQNLEIQDQVSVCAHWNGEDAHVHAALWVWLVLLYLLSWPLESLSGSLHHCCVDLAVLFAYPFSWQWLAWERDSNEMKLFSLNLFVVAVWVKLVINKELCSCK